MNRHLLILTGRALRGRFIRTSLTIGGIAATSMLVVILLATHRSLTTGVETYAGQPGVDLWVAPKGTDNLIRATGFLPVIRDTTEAIELGVTTFNHIMRAFVSVSLPGGSQTGKDAATAGRLTLLAIGYEIPNGLGGPPRVVAGRAPSTFDEVTLDRGAAHRLGVEPGDSILVNEWKVQLVGITRGTNLLATQFMFTGIENLWDYNARWDQASFILVRLEPGADPEVVVREVEERFPEVHVYTRQQFLSNNLREVAAGMLPILGLVAILGVGVSSVLVVLLIQGLVEDRREDIAVMLAMGNSAFNTGLSLIVRASVLVFSGCLAGSLLAIALARVLDRAAPHIEFTFAAGHFAIVFIIFMAAGLFATLIPLLRLRNVDPLEVFRA
jgi:putative ABC transport system permease protein